jgi:CO/xanthine dehydrogenase FAD-binding subunit
MVRTLLRPRDAAEALAMLEGEPGSLPLAGGTYLLSSQFDERPMTLVSVARLLPSALELEHGGLRVGANATFQDIVDSRIAPDALRYAALCMANRNVRNRATAGGNIGANKACGTLLPLLLAANATVRLAGGDGEVPAAEWLAHRREGPRGLVESLFIPLPSGRRVSYRRWARTACDISILIAAVSMEGLPSPSSPISGLRIALGGLGPQARRSPELEALFEGRPFLGIGEAQAAIAPILSPQGDLRGSAAFKRLRGAALLAEAIAAAVSGGVGGKP